MNFREALTAIVDLFADLGRGEVSASTKLDSKIFSSPQQVRRFSDALEMTIGLRLTPAEILDCSTVADLARKIMFKSGPSTSGLWQYTPAQKPSEEGRDYTIWYATNRRPRVTFKGDMIDYTGERDVKTHYGQCQVFVPKSHKIGSLGSPLWKRLLTRSDDRLRILSIDALSEEAYWEGIREALSEANPDERDAVVYVHGYNVSFLEAALRTAQIGFDLGIQGAMALFSWPSQGKMTDYMVDEATIDASEEAITRFVSDIAVRSGARAVHLIAHSMGNRGVIRAMDRLASGSTSTRFNQIILAAPDLDTDVFLRLATAYTKLSARTTLYVSSRDLAVNTSRWLHSYPRAGFVPPVCIAPGIDTVNVTNVDVSMLGHGYVAEAREVLQDMHSLIAYGTPPGKRFALRPAKAEDGKPFWNMGA